MRLAEALSQRKDLEARITKIKELLQNVVRIQGGDQPAENPEELLSEMDQCLERLEYLIYRINVSNMQIVAEDGKNMTLLLAERDVLAKRIAILRNTFNEASSSGSRYRNEIRYVTTIDVKALRQQLGQFSQEYRQLDMKIQELNFTYDLVE